MPRRADINKEKGRLSRKHGRRARIKKELGIAAPVKPKTKQKTSLSKKKK